MKRLLIVFFALPLSLFAQNKPLIAEGAAPALYLTHTVAPKENYYSIGRIYNISPKEIAPFNNMELEKGLSLGQVIKIPLEATNFIQEGEAGFDETLVPVYHIVQGKESLYRVSVNYNKVPVESVKKWNNLKSDALTNGSKLVIGYLKVKKDLSTLAPMGVTKPAGNIAAATTKPVEKIDVKKDVAQVTTPVVKDVPKEPVTKTPPPPPAKKEVVEEPVQKTTEPQSTVTKITTKERKSFDGGIFKSDYDKQVKNHSVKDETGNAGTFKSTSGWDDGKYYCLHNTSVPGTIIKITNPANGKSVYAKVLDVIPDLHQNDNLSIRISNAAADELGAGDMASFSCSLSYVK